MKKVIVAAVIAATLIGCATAPKNRPATASDIATMHPSDVAACLMGMPIHSGPVILTGAQNLCVDQAAEWDRKKTHTDEQIALYIAAGKVKVQQYAATQKRRNEIDDRERQRNTALWAAYMMAPTCEFNC